VRLFLELIAVFFALLTVYRRIIEPFKEGLRGRKQPYNEANAGQKVKFQSSGKRREMKIIDPKEIKDAEFEEIK
jgi:hypothetical protein